MSEEQDNQLRNDMDTKKAESQFGQYLLFGILLAVVVVLIIWIVAAAVR